MVGLLDMIRLYIRDFPYVRRILPERVAGQLAPSWSLEVLLLGVLLGLANGIEVEGVVITLGKPNDDLVPAGETTGGVEAVAELPYDPVPHAEAKRLKQREELDVKRNDLPIVDIIANLPADAAFRMQYPEAFLNHFVLLVEIGVEAKALLVFLPKVVWGRRDDKLSGTVWYLRQEL
jgi:hypothetical protein